MNKNKIIYWLATGLLCIVFLFSSMMYLFKYTMVSGFFENLGFPVWLIYPLAIAKIIGIIALLTKKSNFLKELAYAGFLFDALLAFSAHFMVKDGGYLMALIAIISIFVSWIYDRKVFGSYTQHINISKNL